jgi:hypothetical protein
MEENAYIMEAIAGVICLALGVRLYWRGRRSAPFSERILAITLLIWGLGYALYDVPYAFIESDGTISPYFSYSSMLVFNLGNVSLALFVKEAFRRREHWAGWMVVAIAFVCLLGATGSAWVGDWEQIDLVDNPGYWPQTFANFAPTVWLGVEGLSLSFSARRRAALERLDALDRRQVLLLGLIGAFWAALEVVITVQDFIYIHEGDWSGALGIVNGALEIFPYLMLWWTFCPPDAYRRRIEGTSIA